MIANLMALSVRARWGVVALFVMFSVWGLVNFLQSNLGLDNLAPQNTNSSGVQCGTGFGQTPCL